MIRFEPDEGVLLLTKKQLDMVVLVIGDNDARVVDHEHTDQYIEVYVGDWAHEALRFTIGKEGELLGVEEDMNDDGDWVPTDWPDGPAFEGRDDGEGQDQGHQG